MKRPALRQAFVGPPALQVAMLLGVIMDRSSVLLEIVGGSRALSVDT